MNRICIQCLCIASLLFVVSCTKDETGKSEVPQDIINNDNNINNNNNNDNNDFQTEEIPDPSSIRTASSDTEKIKGKWQYYGSFNRYAVEPAGRDHDDLSPLSWPQNTDLWDFGQNQSWIISEEFEDANNAIQSEEKADGRYVLLTDEGLLQLYNYKTQTYPSEVYYYKVSDKYLYISKNENQDYDVYKRVVNNTPAYVIKHTEDYVFDIYTELKGASIAGREKPHYEVVDDLTIPSSVTYRGSKYNVFAIGTGLFYGTSIYSVNIPASIKVINVNAFRNCRYLTFVQIPNSVTYLGGSTFKDCERLSSVVLPEGITAIQSSTFAECKSLESIKIPNKVVRIGEYAFYNTALSRLELPNGLKRIGQYAFCNTALSDLVMPNGVEKLGDWAFAGCEKLESVVIPNSVTYLGVSCFQYCTLLSKIDIPNGITTIYRDAFEGCQSLRTVTIGSGCKTIQDRAFDTTGGSITRSGEYNCITDVYCKAENPPTLGWDRVFNTNENSVLHVPASSIEKYKSSDSWSYYFSNIVAL